MRKFPARVSIGHFGCNTDSAYLACAYCLCDKEKMEHTRVGLRMCVFL